MRMRHAGDAEIGPERLPVSFAILDNTHLTAASVPWLCARCRQLVVITSNEAHPAFAVGEDNLSIMLQERPSLTRVLRRLRSTTDANA